MCPRSVFVGARTPVCSHFLGPSSVDVCIGLEPVRCSEVHVFLLLLLIAVPTRSVAHIFALQCNIFLHHNLGKTCNLFIITVRALFLVR